MKVKKRMNQLWIVAALFIGLNTAIQAQGYLQANGHVIVNGDGDTVLLRSIGLGGWMVQEGYMLQTSGFANPQHEIRAEIEALIGVENTDTFYTAWLDNYTTRADVEAIAAAGYNSIRMPMHYNLYTPSIQDEPVQGQITWLNKGFDLTDSMLAWCKDNNLYLILDLHAAPGGQGHDQGISDYNPAYPSLWQSEYNRAKTVALWYKLAERYSSEEMIGGYDLINETNWDLPGGTSLKNLYKRITDTIRLVDQNHILFIEGNWFANDFSGLTTPWDANMAYSFHKYWAYNNLSSIQGYLNMRNSSNRPLWCGEAGENSNVWYTNAITQFEDKSIGWAWWTWKKFESISGQTSVITTPDYKTLLNYWNNGGTKPTEEFAKAALMEMIEQIKLENCKINTDVQDAMFRQLQTNETLPFAANTIPGLIYATDYDYGRNGIAYSDIDTADYHVSTNVYTAWNSGYAYRNDGVDIEANTDVVNSNGYNVGWTNPGEWMQYTVNIDSTAAYDLILRHAGPSANSQIRFSLNDLGITGSIVPTATGGWATFKSDTIENVLLEKGIHALKIVFDKSGVNVGSFLFANPKSYEEAAFQLLSAVTEGDGSEILVTLNKSLALGLSPDIDEFILTVDGEDVPISSISISPISDKILVVEPTGLLFSNEVITLSYNGTSITSALSNALEDFTDFPVINHLTTVNGLGRNLQSGNLSIYPNPANTELYVDFGKLASVSNATIEVLDITGKIIHSENFSAKGFTNYAVDVSQLENGIYFITIQSEQLSYTSKFVIKH